MANVDTAVAGGSMVSGHSTWACRGEQNVSELFLPIHLSQDGRLTDCASTDRYVHLNTRDISGQKDDTKKHMGSFPLWSLCSVSMLIGVC